MQPKFIRRDQQTISPFGDVVPQPVDGFSSLAGCIKAREETIGELRCVLLRLRFV